MGLTQDVWAAAPLYKVVVGGGEGGLWSIPPVL